MEFRAMWIRVLGLVAISLVCASCAPSLLYRGKMVNRLETSGLKIESDEQAKEAILSLRDNSLFPYLEIDDVEFTNVGITLRGPMKRRYVWESYGSGSAIVSSVAGVTVGVSNDTTMQVAQVKENKESINIWYEDVYAIALTEYQDLEGYGVEFVLDHTVPGETEYECVLQVTDRGTLVFRTKAKTFAKRLALAFAYKCPKAKWIEAPFPAVGAIADKETGRVFLVKKNGAFEKSGIPVFSIIKDVDGRALEPKDVNAALEKLGIGKHEILYFNPKGHEVFRDKGQVEIR